MSYDNSINKTTLLLSIILVILIFIILYKNKESKKENIDNIDNNVRDNIFNLQTNLSLQYNYDVESWSIETTGAAGGGNWGKDKQITIITNYNTNTVTLFQLKPPKIEIYTLNDKKLNTISPNEIIFFDKNIIDNNIFDSTLNIKDNSNNILLSIDKYPKVDGIKLKNDLMNNKMFTIQTNDIDLNLLKTQVVVSARTSRSPLEEIFIDDKLTVEPNLFNLHKKCLNNKADSIQQFLNDFAIYVKDFQNKNQNMTLLTFILNENTRDKIRNIINIMKTVNDNEFDCLYINKDAPFNVCNVAQNIRESDSNQFINMLNQIILAEKFIMLYHTEIIDIKTILLPKIIHFITVCDKIKKEDKKNLLTLFKKIINIVNYVAYIIGGNNNLIVQIDNSLKYI